MFLYTLAIAILMVSRLPVFSGKRVGKRVAPEMVLPVFVLVVAFFALLIAYPWVVLAIGTLVYLASLPFGVRRLPQARAGRAAAAGSRAPRRRRRARGSCRTAAGEPPTSRASGAAQLAASKSLSSALRGRGAALPS